ncbi:MAG: ferredoxin--NADP reductase, partial [Bacteroidota bacterium]
EQKPTFSYLAGQYLTLRFFIDGQEARRAYSMSSSPLEQGPAVSIKRVKGGLVSNHVADNVQVGIQVEVMPPQGKFTVSPNPEKRYDYYLFGAGSGITPLMSIIKTLLEEEPKSSIYLLYGNRDENSIIFQDQLNQLSEKYAGQLVVEHTLSRPKRKKTGTLASWFTGGKVVWTGRTGRIGDSMVQEFLDKFPNDAPDARYFICGPGDMIDIVEASLQSRGIDSQQIFTERFVSANDVKGKSNGHHNGKAKIIAKVNGQEVSVELKPGQSILDGLLEAKANPPYSCLAGACSTCAAKVIKGGVKMEVCYALDDDEVADGMILTCQSHPTTEEVIVDYNL